MLLKLPCSRRYCKVCNYRQIQMSSKGIIKVNHFRILWSSKLGLWWSHFELKAVKSLSNLCTIYEFGNHCLLPHQSPSSYMAEPQMLSVVLLSQKVACYSRVTVLLTIHRSWHALWKGRDKEVVSCFGFCQLCLICERCQTWREALERENADPVHVSYSS